MAISEAKLAANRRNSKLSTGPRTAAGRQRSSLNATKYGIRAETLVLPDEDPQVLDDRRAAWRACLLPGDDVEERLVDDAVVYTWQQDRARRAQAKRISANVTNYGVDQDQTNEKEVAELGRRLFTDRLGPLVAYPSSSGNAGSYQIRRPSTSYAGEQENPDEPADLVLSLQSTLLGCETMLGEWAKLKGILDQGQPWVSYDKLKAVRLLGKQPFDAIDEKDVALVFLASYVLKPERRWWYWEILMEMTDVDTKTFRRNAAHRQLRSLKPKDATEARQVLLAIIERATERLTAKADAHRERARVMAELVPDILAFDDTPDGERLRRFDLASGRGLARSLGELRRHRSSSVVSGPLSVVSGPLSVVGGPLAVAGCKAEAVTEPIATDESVSGPLSVVSGPLSVGGCVADAIEEPTATNEPTKAYENVTNEPTEVRENATNEPTEARENSTNEPTAAHRNAMNEPTAACENVTNEPTAIHENVTNEPTVGRLSVVRGPLPVVSCNVKALDEASATNEPTDAGENATNEPTADQENATNEPTDAGENATNEPTADHENATNEPTDAGENATNEPTADHENATNEPTDAGENTTNEPKLPADSVGGQGEGLSVGNGDGEETGFEEGFSVAVSESIQKGCEKVRLARAERLRALNEEARREAEAAMALRRALFREPRNKKKSAKPGKQRTGRTTRSGQNRKNENAAQNKRDLDEFVERAFALSDVVNSALS